MENVSNMPVVKKVVILTREGVLSVVKTAEFVMKRGVRSVRKGLTTIRTKAYVKVKNVGREHSLRMGSVNNVLIIASSVTNRGVIAVKRSLHW